MRNGIASDFSVPCQASHFAANSVRRRRISASGSGMALSLERQLRGGNREKRALSELARHLGEPALASLEGVDEMLVGSFVAQRSGGPLGSTASLFDEEHRSIDFAE